MLEPMATALEAVVERAQRAARSSWSTPTAARGSSATPTAYRRRLRRVLARSDVVKVSEEDLAWLEPERSAADAARTLLAGRARASGCSRAAATASPS